MATYNITLTLIADAYVDQQNPNTNYGSGAYVETSDTVVGNTSYLKRAFFEVGFPSLTTYKNKRFKNLVGTFNVTAFAGDANCAFFASTTNSTVVTESNLTYNSYLSESFETGAFEKFWVTATGLRQVTLPDVTTVFNRLAKGEMSRLFLGLSQAEFYYSNWYARISSDESANPATFSVVCEDCPPSKPRAISPTGSFEDGSAVIRISWEYLHDISPIQNKFDLLWSSDNGSTWNTITQTTANQYCDVPANTFPDGLILWKVKTYNEYNEASVDSDTLFFYSIAAPGKPNVEVTNVATAQPTIKWVHGSEQHVYETLIMQGTNEIYSSGEMPSMTAREITPAIWLADGSYTAKVRVKNKYGLWSEYGELSFTISTTKPAKPTITLTKDAKSIILDGGAVDAAKYLVYRSLADAATFVEIMETASLPVSDYTAASDVEYDYFIRSISATNTFNDSDTATETLTFKSTIIALAENPSTYTELKHNLGRKPPRIEVYMPSVMQNYFVGRVRPVAELPEHESRMVSIEHYVKTMPELIAALAVLRSRKTLFYRDARGRAFNCVLTALEASEAATGYLIKAQLLEVDYD